MPDALWSLLGYVFSAVQATWVSMTAAGFLAATLAGVGGCLYGVRLADAVNRKLGRDAPPVEEKQRRVTQEDK